MRAHRAGLPMMAFRLSMEQRSKAGARTPVRYSNSPIVTVHGMRQCSTVSARLAAISASTAAVRLAAWCLMAPETYMVPQIPEVGTTTEILRAVQVLSLSFLSVVVAPGPKLCFIASAPKLNATTALFQ